jgi:hypothetical protein
MDYGRLETANTRALAWLFDPKSAHGFGDTILRAFLQSIPSDFQSQPFSVEYVIPEHWFSNGGKNENGRIDVYATGHFGKGPQASVPWVLVVEAKIDASEQPAQLERYERWVETRHPNAYFLPVFLTPEGKPPETAAGDWMCVSFRSLACSLRRAYSKLDEESPGFHFLRYFVAGILMDVCGWRLPLPPATECTDPYGYLDYLRTVHESED